ncbi:MAG TPA: CdaR family protein [Candidatus Limnocylindrales bacterium]|nr:CdaR family protein [Candidatus Limnocylindrales bacterium]
MTIVRFLIRNWPLKVAAIVLATLLYAGFVVSQNARDVSVSIPIEADRQPADAVLLTDLGTVSRITYIVTDGSDLRPSTSSFRATVDLSDVDPALGPTFVPVRLEAVDERIRIITWEPLRVRVQLDPFVTRTVPVQVQAGEIPEGLDVRDPVVDPAEVEVSGPQSVVERVVAVRAAVLIEPSALNVDRDVPLVPIDLVGEVLRPIDVEPATAHVTIAVFRDLSNRSLPVSPRVAGTPATGFEIESVTVDPVLVSVEGNADELASLDRISTDPISIAGAASDIETLVQLDLPTGILALGEPTVRVTIRLRPVTETRSFTAGIRLVGAREDRTYALSADRVVVTIFGSPADLNRLAGLPLTVDAPVADLDPGASLVRLGANLATGLTLVSIAPATITVTVGVSVTPSPEPAVSPSPSPSPAP